MRLGSFGTALVIAVLALRVAALDLAVAAGPPVAVDVTVRARELVPGEPVRVVVSGGPSVADIGGTFLGADLSFQRRGDLWLAWVAIPLDHPGGAAAVEVRGTTIDGAAVVGARAVTIEARAFPEEHLSVSSKYVEPPADIVRRTERERARMAEIYRLRTPPSDDGGVFVRPVDGEPTSVFGTRRFFNDEPRSPHPGLDLRAAEGTPVRCSGPGTVVVAEDLYYSGGTVVVDHGGGLFTLYAHLSGIDVHDGAAVAAGEVVGRPGATGRVTGPHLHWGAKIGDVPFDPRALLDEGLFR